MLQSLVHFEPTYHSRNPDEVRKLERALVVLDKCVGFDTLSSDPVMVNVERRNGYIHLVVNAPRLPRIRIMPGDETSPIIGLDYRDEVALIYIAERGLGKVTHFEFHPVYKSE